MGDKIKSIDKIFNENYNKWYEGTKYLSSSKIYDNEYYRNIVSLGVYVIPCIIEKLKESPVQLFEALAEITGEDPVPENHWGDMEKMAEDWINWWDKKNNAFK